MTRGVPAALLHRPRRKFPEAPAPEPAPVVAEPAPAPAPAPVVAEPAFVPDPEPELVAEPEPVAEPEWSLANSKTELLEAAKKKGLNVNETMKKADILAALLA